MLCHHLLLLLMPFMSARDGRGLLIDSMFGVLFGKKRND